MRKVIKKRLRHEAEGLNVAADIDAVIAVDHGEGGKSGAAAVSRQKVVQRSRRRAGSAGTAKRKEER